MALPKHFNRTKNTQNRIKSLNDLIFCTVNYDFTLTGEEVENFNTQEEITGVKDFSGLNEEQVKAKIENWFTVLREKNIIKDYVINSIENKTVYEALKEKGLTR
jgi:hypothetical protein